jgi:hypothetical protein
MSTIINYHTTPTRRSALGFSAAAFSAGFTTPALARPAPNRDAMLIRLCADFRRQHRLVLDLARADADQPEDALDWAMIKRWGPQRGGAIGRGDRGGESEENRIPDSP